MDVPNPLGSPPEEHLFNSIFSAELMRRLDGVITSKSRFVHYTSAEVAMSIIQNAEIWMRNTTTMNDFSEVEHGQQCVREAWISSSGERLQRALEAIHPGIAAEITERYDAWQPDMRSNTYITCISEHPPEEDEYGRLSMWRAYGGIAGVALVLNLTPFLATTDELAAFSSPVFYGTGKDIEVRIDEMAARLEQHGEELRKYGKSVLSENVFSALHFAALCTKHPAFREEREWRVIYSPNLAQSPVIKPVIRSVRGTPQTVQFLPLKHAPEVGLHHADIPSLVDRVIIGPTDNAWVLYEAFKRLLTDAGVQNAHDRISVSQIPLRHYS
ncbi:DUF2971 domain-containing protein [Caulobacter sp. ErkDOM-E]|uniref:DUF2971 domain-containing protein n=1 Tax=Caulobacter sp. ErkDOM-E TaxID=3402778 RepID=UPI003AF553BF